MTRSPVVTMVRIALAKDAGIPGPGISRGRGRAQEKQRPPEAIHQVIEALDSLSPAQRDLLRLRASGMTLGRLAKLAGVSVATMHGRCKRAEAALAEAIARLDLPEGMLW